MNVITVIILIFAMLGALDRIFGNRFGLGAEFERSFRLFEPMALSMIGMLILAPVLGRWGMPLFESFHQLLKIDPSIIPASLFANDMGGTSLSLEIAADPSVGAFNAYVVSSMMGCVISFTIPFASGVVPASQHREMFLGFLYGIVTIPVGCLVSGFLCGLNLAQILLDLLPLILLSALIAVGLKFAPALCVKIFRLFGIAMKTLITLGLMLGIFTFLTGRTVLEGAETLEASALICVNACITLAGAFPFMALLGRLLRRPMTAVGKKLGINSVSALAIIPTLITNATTFGMMKDMDKRGVVLNSAFAVSAAFTFGGHLGFTMAMDERYLLPMIAGKLISGLSALLLVLLLFREPSESPDPKGVTYDACQ